MVLKHSSILSVWSSVEAAVWLLWKRPELPPVRHQSTLCSRGVWVIRGEPAALECLACIYLHSNVLLLRTLRITFQQIWVLVHISRLLLTSGGEFQRVPICNLAGFVIACEEHPAS